MGRAGLLTAHHFLAVLKENFNLLRTDHSLYKTKSKNRMVDQGIDLISTGHGIVRRPCRVHAWSQRFPLFAFGILAVGGGFPDGLFDGGGRPIPMLATADLALHLDRYLFGHGDNDVFGIFAAFGATCFDLIA